MQTSAHISAFMRCVSSCFIPPAFFVPRPFDLFVACGWVPKHVKTSQDKFDLTRIKALQRQSVSKYRLGNHRGIGKARGAWRLACYLSQKLCLKCWWYVWQAKQATCLLGGMSPVRSAP